MFITIIYYRLNLIRFINYIIGLYLWYYYLYTVEYVFTELINLKFTLNVNFKIFLFFEKNTKSFVTANPNNQNLVLYCYYLYIILVLCFNV